MPAADEARPPTMLQLPSYLAGHVSRIGREALAAELDRYGLRPPHLAVLVGLHDLGPLTQLELARRLRFNPSHLVGYLDHLTEASLVVRERDPDDRRRQIVALTRSGRQRTTTLVKRARSIETTSLSVLTAAERTTLTELLARVVTHDDLGED